MRILIQLITYGVLLYLLMRAIAISSMTVKLIFSGIAVGSFIFMKWKPDWMRYILAGLCVVFVFLSGIYNIRNLDTVLPMTKNETQTVYSQQCMEDGTYPDSFLRLLVRDKKVTIPFKTRDYGEYVRNRNKKDGEHFPAKYFKENNYARFFDTYAKETVVDETLSGNDIAGQKDDFTWIGYGSDMLRYTFLLNTDGVQQSTYFWYSWYYYSFYGESSGHDIAIYVNMEDVAESDELIAIWTQEEDLYLMTQDYYERKFADEQL